MGDITQLLGDARSGTPGAKEALFSRLYTELQAVARARLSRMPELTLLDPASLVHEVYLRFAAGATPAHSDRKLFLSYAGGVMRHVVIDYVRERNAQKRGSGNRAITLTTRNLATNLETVDASRLTDALDDLRRIDARCAEVVDLRFFGGMEIDETASALGVSAATVKRDWQKARAFLLAALAE